MELESPPTNRYSAAMLAQLADVHVARVRVWQRRGWIVPASETHRLASFDFTELTVARQLGALERAGATPRLLERKLAEIHRRWPEVGRPLAELSLVLDGKKLLVRRGDELLDSRGQLLLDFDAPSDDRPEPPAANILSSKAFLSRRPVIDGAEATPEQFAAWAAERDEAGDLQLAAELYRVAMAAGGPKPEWCFQLAEALYRAGDLPAARERYFMAIELDEDYVEARANLGCVLLDLGEKELAVAAFEGALGSLEEYADAHYHLARTLDDLGQAAAAATHWSRFLELAPDSPWADEARERLAE